MLRKVETKVEKSIGLSCSPVLDSLQSTLTLFLVHNIGACMTGTSLSGVTLIYHSTGKCDRDLTLSPYARWPEGPRALLSKRSEL